MAHLSIVRVLSVITIAAAGLVVAGPAHSGQVALAQEIEIHPAHTQEGTCEQPGAIVSTLSPVSTAYVVDGEPMVVPEVVGSPNNVPVEYSSTTLPVSLAQILDGQFIVDVKVSEDDQANSVACGDIGGLMLGTSDLPISMLPIGDSGHVGTAWLHDNGNGTTTLSIALISLVPVQAPETAASGATIQVSIQDFAFDPSSIKAAVGDTIVFTNNDAVPHTVTQQVDGGNAGFASDSIAPGETYALTISDAGTYAFYCSFHPAMTGTIVATG